MIKLILVLVIAYISLSHACECFHPPGWQKDEYCNTVFAAKIKILSEGYNCNEIYKCYDILTVQQYKGPPITNTVLETSDTFETCGLSFAQGHTYFVAANPKDEITMGLGLCSLYDDWTGLSCCEMIQRANLFLLN